MPNIFVADDRDPALASPQELRQRLMHLSQELGSGFICVTAEQPVDVDHQTAPWMQKFYTINDTWQAGDRRKLLAFARDLVNSDYAGHRLTFQLFAQSPP